MQRKLRVISNNFRLSEVEDPTQDETGGEISGVDMAKNSFKHRSIGFDTDAHHESEVLLVSDPPTTG